MLFLVLLLVLLWFLGVITKTTLGGALHILLIVAIVLGLVGRKGRDFCRRRGFLVRIEEIGIFQRVRYADAKRIAEAAIEEFSSGGVDRVFIVYNEFKSVMQQRVTVEQLLPIPKLGGGSLEAGSEKQDPAYI